MTAQGSAGSPATRYWAQEFIRFYRLWKDGTWVNPSLDAELWRDVQYYRSLYINAATADRRGRYPNQPTR